MVLIPNPQFNDYKSKPGEENRSEGDTLSKAEAGEPLLNEDEHNSNFTPKIYPQIIATSIVSIGGLLVGFMLGWADPAIRFLTSNTTENAYGKPFGSQALNYNDITLLGSIAFLGAITATIFVGVFMNRTGRKNTIFCLIIPVSIGWLLTGLSEIIKLFGVLLIARFLQGFSGGFSFVVTVYIAEISSDQIRGTLCSVFSVALVFGLFIEFVLGLFLNYAWLGIFNLCCMIPFPILLIFLPDSPIYYVKMGKISEAATALTFFRGAEYEEQIGPELEMIIQRIEEDNKSPFKLSELLTKSILKPFLVALGLMLFQQWSAIPIVVTLPSKIFQQAESSVSPEDGSIIIAAVQLIVVIGSTIFIESIGRKVLLVISEVGICISLLALGTGMYFLDKKEVDKEFSLGWLPISSLCCYIIFYNLALGPVPWIILGEIVPLRAQGIVSTIVCSFVWILSFIIIMIYSEKQVFISLYVFAGLSILGIIFVIFFVKETKGRSFEEIRVLYS